MTRSTDLLVREARRSAGLSQAELAAMLGTTQSAISRLERRGANPRVETLARVLSACGQELAFDARPHRSSVDESQIAERLRLSPGERIKSFERSYANVREIALAGARSRGELA
jgi:transcriptional regulator with XRE-family HTH domain